MQKPKMTQLKLAMAVIPTWALKESNWDSTSQLNILQRYCRFVLVTSSPKDLSIILKFSMNKWNLPNLLSLNKAILNSYEPDFSDVGYLRNLIFTQSFSAFLSFLLSINLIWGGFLSVCTTPVIQSFYAIFSSS